MDKYNRNKAGEFLVLSLPFRRLSTSHGYETLEECLKWSLQGISQGSLNVSSHPSDNTMRHSEGLSGRKCPVTIRLISRPMLLWTNIINKAGAFLVLSLPFRSLSLSHDYETLEDCLRWFPREISWGSLHVSFHNMNTIYEECYSELPQVSFHK